MINRDKKKKKKFLEKINLKKVEIWLYNKFKNKWNLKTHKSTYLKIVEPETRN